MSLTEIQRAVGELSVEERRELAAWIISTYPLLQVDRLLARAAQLVEDGEWQPTSPTSDNQPEGKVLEHALRTVKQLGLDK